MANSSHLARLRSMELCNNARGSVSLFVEVSSGPHKSLQCVMFKQSHLQELMLSDIPNYLALG